MPFSFVVSQSERHRMKFRCLRQLSHVSGLSNYPRLAEFNHVVLRPYHCSSTHGGGVTFRFQKKNRLLINQSATFSSPWGGHSGQSSKNGDEFRPFFFCNFQILWHVPCCAAHFWSFMADTTSRAKKKTLPEGACCFIDDR